MSELLTIADEMLRDAGFSCQRTVIGERDALIFEDLTALGFLFAYDNPEDLVSNWDQASTKAISDNQLSLRRAGQKAWNTYVVLLSALPADLRLSVALTSIEENLAQTRKIARAGIRGSSDMRAALLPLLPIQSAPDLGVINIGAEIRQRSTQVPSRAVDAFLSKADESVVLQALEQLS